MDNISIKISELVEYAGLMSRMAFDPELKTVLNLGGPLTEIRDKTNGMMTFLLHNEIHYFAKGLLMHQLARHYAYHENVKTVDEFLQRVRAMKRGELLDAYYYSLIEMKSTEEESLIKARIEDDDYLDMIGFEYEVLMEFTQQFEEMQQRLINFFQNYYNKVFLPNQVLIMSTAENERQKFQSFYEEDPVGFVQLLIKTNGDEFLKNGNYKAHFYVNVTYPNNATFTMDDDIPDRMYINYGVYVMEALKVMASEEMIKYLGESTKLSIVKLLTKQHMYASEVATALDLNRATISHHLLQLVKVGVVEIAYTKGNKAFYKINKKQIRAGFDNFLEQLT